MNQMGLKPIAVAYIDVAAASASVALPKGSYYMITFAPDAKLGETGGGCWVEFGGSGVAAAAHAGQSFFVPENTIMCIQKPDQGEATNRAVATHIAAIEAAAAGDGWLTIVGMG
jgi:hypothetical protein